MSRLGAAAVLQVKDWGGGILCLLQNSRGLQPYICLISGRSDFAAIIIHGVLLSMKYCCRQQGDGDEQRRVKKLKVTVCLFTAWAKHARCYLKDFGAVLKGVRVADVIDQTDNVAGQVSIRQVVEVREHFMKLSGEKNMDYSKFKMLSEAKKKQQHLTVLLRMFSFFCSTDAAVQ